MNVPRSENENVVLWVSASVFRKIVQQTQDSFIGHVQFESTTELRLNFDFSAPYDLIKSLTESSINLINLT